MQLRPKASLLHHHRRHNDRQKFTDGNIQSVIVVLVDDVHRQFHIQRGFHLPANYRHGDQQERRPSFDRDASMHLLDHRVMLHASLDVACPRLGAFHADYHVTMRTVLVLQ